MISSRDISNDAAAALGSDHLARLWLERPSPLFDGMTPAQALAHPRHNARVRNQLNWFAGISRQELDTEEPDLNDVLSDPIVHLALASAGSGPEELLALCHQARMRKQRQSATRAA